jgi:S1-C subfamily serine protease
VDEAGHIVTNFHVVRRQRRQGHLWDHKTYDADDRCGAELRSGGAAHPLPKSNDADPAGAQPDLQVGQSVYAIGNFGLTRRHHGRGSALGRTIETETRRRIEDVIRRTRPSIPGTPEAATWSGSPSCGR